MHSLLAFVILSKGHPPLRMAEVEGSAVALRKSGEKGSLALAAFPVAK
jgi:hypothetical protein